MRRHAGRLFSITLAVLLAACAAPESGSAPEPTPTAAEGMTTPVPPKRARKERGLHLATLVRLARPDTASGTRASEVAWNLLRQQLQPIEDRLGVRTVLEDVVESTSKDCGSERWDRLLIQHFPNVGTLAALLRDPERAAVMSSWDATVDDYFRILGWPLAPPERLALDVAEATRDRLLLLQSNDRAQAQRAITAESVFFDPARAQVLMQHEVPPDLNEIDMPWDLFTVTRYATSEILDHPPADLAAIQTQRDRATVRTCRVIGRPIATDQHR